MSKGVRMKTASEVLSKIQLSKNFKAVEFANSEDGYAIELPNPDLIVKLQKLRDTVGSMTITSGFRTVAYNKKCGGSTNSYHLQGLAVDCRFSFTGHNKDSLTKLFQSIGFTNVNFYWNKDKTLNRVHLDIGKTWNNQKFNYNDKFL